jgi:lipoprotein-anchoring transpeptidase ErfK/SrfK
MTSSRTLFSAGSIALIATLSGGIANAEPYSAYLNQPEAQVSVAPQADQLVPADQAEDVQLPPRLQRQIVDYATKEAPGTVIVDTPHTYLYLVLGDGKAMRYGIGVGREGFTWSGVKQVARKAEWPDWYPPAAMIARQPYLPRMTAGGPGNPLGARAMYIGGTEYRIHGTNDPTTIGKNVSSGCIRLTNEDVKDLYERVKIGAKVIVLPQTYEAKAKASTHSAQLPKAEQVSMNSSFAPVSLSPAARAWDNIR